MLRASILAAAFAMTTLFAGSAHADRHDIYVWGSGPQIFDPVQVKQHRHAERSPQRHIKHRLHHRDGPPINHRYASGTEMQIVAHPAGCPARSFCGCGVALHVFGKPIRELWLASNWFAFPRAHAGPGMVAVRKHHVMAILEAFGDGTASVYDPNSGAHLTRIHRRSLAGYTIVDPRAGRRYAVAR